MFVVLSPSLHFLEYLNTPNTPYSHIDFCGRSSPNDLTSYLIWMHLLVCWVIIDLVVLSLDYCRVNGCDADGDYSIISNCTRQHLQMEPYILAKEAAGLSASLQSCDYLKRLIFFSPDFKQKLKMIWNTDDCGFMFPIISFLYSLTQFGNTHKYTQSIWTCL